MRRLMLDADAPTIPQDERPMVPGAGLVIVGLLSCLLWVAIMGIAALL